MKTASKTGKRKSKKPGKVTTAKKRTVKRAIPKYKKETEEALLTYPNVRGLG